MADQKSVVQALKDSLRNQHCGFIEGVGNVYAVSEETINDTLELLKEQEAVRPFIRIHDANMSNGTECVCGYCNGSFLHQHVKFCPWCGRAVKWDD